MSTLIPIEHTAIQLAYAIKSDVVTAEGPAPPAERTLPILELIWEAGQGWIKVKLWWAIRDNSDVFSKRPGGHGYVGRNDVDKPSS